MKVAEVKGQSLPAYDPRAIKGIGVKSSHEVEVREFSLNSENIAKNDTVIATAHVQYDGEIEGPVIGLIQKYESSWNLFSKLLVKNRTLNLKVDGELRNKKRVNLDFGESKDISFSVKMSELGSHSLSIENIIRNCRVLAPPDFLVENFRLEERQITLENMVSGTFDIKNNGGIKGTKAVNIKIGKKIKTKKVTLEPGESKTVDFAIEVKEVGEQEIELENLSTSINVVKPATFEYTDLSISEKNIYLGEAVEVSLKVKNTGDIEGEKKVKLYLNGNVEKKRKLPLTLTRLKN